VAVTELFMTNRSCRSADKTGHRRREAGFALILALLALMLLTFLGLTLAATTSTELQIATNYRWSQQALFNAEAGVEAGKAILRSLNWQAILPTPRTDPWPGTDTICGLSGTPGIGCTNYAEADDDVWGNDSRNYENAGCDTRGDGMGYGVVLDPGINADPYQYQTSVLGHSLNGAFTLWIRRPLLINPQGLFYEDGTTHDNLILVSEGTAPFTGKSFETSASVASRATQVIEVTLSRKAPNAPPVCGTRGGQAGGGPEGAGFGACAAITGEGVGAGTGTGGATGPADQWGVK
jgi:hypothetical protein